MMSRMFTRMLAVAIVVVAGGTSRAEQEPFAFEHGLNCMAWSPDGKLIVGGCPRVHPYLAVWDAETGKRVARFEVVHHTACVGFSADSKRVFSVCFGGMDHIEIWDLATKKKVSKFKIPWEGGFYACRAAMSPDGTRFVSGAQFTNQFQVWQLPKGRVEWIEKGDFGEAWCCLYSPDGKTLATGCSDCTVRLWSLEIKDEVARLKGHEGAVLDLAFADGGKSLVSVACDGGVRVWDVGTGKATRAFLATRIEKPLEPSAHSPFRAALSRDGSTAVFATGKTFEVWNVNKGERLHALPIEGFEAFAVSPDGKRMLAGSGKVTDGEGKLVLWNLETGRRASG